jgi:hypothetical protein
MNRNDFRIQISPLFQLPFHLFHINTIFNQQQLFVVCSLIANIDGSQSTCHAAALRGASYQHENPT